MAEGLLLLSCMSGFSTEREQEFESPTKIFDLVAKN